MNGKHFLNYLICKLIKMKKLIFLLLTLFCVSCIPLPAQTSATVAVRTDILRWEPDVDLGISFNNDNAIYFTFQPVDYGLGIRYDYTLDNLGMYSSISYSNWGLYKQYDLQNHIKFTTGIRIPLRDYNGCSFDFTAGLNYHYLQSAVLNNELVKPTIFNPLSFELGLLVRLRR